MKPVLPTGKFRSSFVGHIKVRISFSSLFRTALCFRFLRQTRFAQRISSTALIVNRVLEIENVRFNFPHNLSSKTPDTFLALHCVLTAQV